VDTEQMKLLNCRSTTYSSYRRVLPDTTGLWPRFSSCRAALPR